MEANDNVENLVPRGAQATIASNRASTGCSYNIKPKPNSDQRLALRSVLPSQPPPSAAIN